MSNIPAREQHRPLRRCVPQDEVVTTTTASSATQMRAEVADIAGGREDE
ncbi:MAG: hypothetical protein ACLTSG_12815 [Lachnospiraceae bacterium]